MLISHTATRRASEGLVRGLARLFLVSVTAAVLVLSGCSNMPADSGFNAFLNGTCQENQRLHLALVERGYSYSMYEMGRLTERGCGLSVTRDPNEAVAWYTEAARRGNRPATKALVRLKQPTPAHDIPDYDIVAANRAAAGKRSWYLGEFLLNLLLAAAYIHADVAPVPAPPPRYSPQKPANPYPASVTKDPAVCVSSLVGSDVYTRCH
jgi:hypothetical protein